MSNKVGPGNPDAIYEDKPGGGGGVAGGSVSKAHEGRVKSLGSKGPNFTRHKGSGTDGIPHPNSPYGRD